MERQGKKEQNMNKEIHQGTSAFTFFVDIGKITLSCINSRESKYYLLMNLSLPHHFYTEESKDFSLFYVAVAFQISDFKT